MGGISIWQLLIIAVIVVLLFGTKKLRGMGGDLGAAVKGFKKALADDPVAESNSKKDADFMTTQQLDQQQTHRQSTKQHDNEQV